MFIFLLIQRSIAVCQIILLNGYSENLEAVIEFNSDRIYAGGNIYDVKSKMTYLADKLNFSVAGKYEDDISALLNANIVFADRELQLNINQLNLNYKRFNIKNNNDLLITYSDEEINFKKFLLSAADGTLSIDGTFGPTKDHNLVVSLEGLSGERVVEDIFGTLGQKKFDADINLQSEISGNFTYPKFNINASAKNIIYGESNFGSLLSNFNYDNNKLNIDVRVIDSTENYTSPAMLITGYIPISLTPVKDSIDVSDEADRAYN